MDVRSLWAGLAGVVIALVSACLVLLSAPAAAIAQSQDTSGQLAQYYYYPNYPYPQVRKKKPRPRRQVTPKCAFPWTYSRGLQRCICVQEGYALSGDNCVKAAELCQKNAEWSQAEQKCKCRDGFVENGGQCTDPNGGVVTYHPAEDEQCLWPRVKARQGTGCECAEGYREQAGQCILDDSPAQAKRPVASPDEMLTRDIALIQKCLKEAGYLRAEAQDTMGRPAWTAFWFFKQDYSVGRTPKGVHDERAQHKLFTLCPKAAVELAELPAGSAPAQGAVADAPQPGILPVPPSAAAPRAASLTPQAEAGTKPAPEEKPVKRVYARPEANCLPEDLYTLIVETYGARPRLKRCTQTCIAMPANITKRQSEELEVKRGIRWCRSCIEIGAQLPLDDILSIERGANVQVCTRPPSRLPKWGPRAVGNRPAYTRVRDLYRLLPQSTENEKTIAVVIGNSTYGKGLPANATAQANAGAFYALLTEHLGFEQENIIDLRDATLDEFNKVFGEAGEIQGELWRRIQDLPEAKVFIYYAGHAGTRADATDSYLLPVDAVKYREERGGYPMSQLYDNLGKAGAKSVMLLLEADFGRDMGDYVFPPNLPEMQVRALPEKPLPGITVMAAGDGDQKTLDDPEYGIGLFTRYVIEGLAGRADLSPIGNADGKIDAVELYAYSSHMVRLAARKSFGLLQKPMVSHSGNLRVTRAQVQGQ